MTILPSANPEDQEELKNQHPFEISRLADVLYRRRTKSGYFMDLALEDEGVRIAVRALGDMRNGGDQQKQSGQQQKQQTQNDARESPRMSNASGSTRHTPALSLSLASTHPASSPPHPSPLEDDRDDPASLPLVSGALHVYEAGKANSRAVQYTSLVSTSLRHASSRLPAGSGERIDEFAGGMLDRGGFVHPHSETNTHGPTGVFPGRAQPSGRRGFMLA
ncbi:hypothetical protein FB451DRAFT_1364431, partial [Mycena latifolia]